MSETTVPKRRRLRTEATAGGAASGSAGATTETVLMRQKQAVRLAKDCIKVAQIGFLCKDCMTNPGATLAAIADVLATTTDSEDEAPGTRQIMLPAEDVVGFDQQ